MGAGGFGDGDFLAFQVAQLLDRRVFAHHDGLGRRRGGFLGEVGELGLGGLGEDRHGVSDVGADVYVAHVQGFEQGQAAGEFVPGYVDVVGF